MSETEKSFFPISELSSYNADRRWTIRARVQNKSVVRTWEKGSSTGKVFSTDLVDADGSEIRASFFQEAVDKFNDMLKVDKIYTFSRGNVRIANRQFNSCNHRYELSFDKLAEVKEVTDGAQIQAVGNLSLTSLRALKTMRLPSTVDLCGIVVHFGDVVQFTSRNNRDLVKRDITIVDDTATSLVVAIWGEKAQQKDAAFAGKPPVCLKRVLITERNNGLQGSLAPNGAMLLRPIEGIGSSEAKKVSQWWEQGGSSQSLAKLTTEGGGYSARAKPIADLASLRREATAVTTPELYTISGCRLAFVNTKKQGDPQPVTYKACQEMRQPENRLCNKKLEPSGVCPACNRPGKAAARFNLRCQFYDLTDGLWLTTFHEGAEKLVGMQAEKVHAMEQTEDGRRELEDTLSKLYFERPLKITVRAKMDNFSNNGQANSRSNMSCVDVMALPLGVHGRIMLDELDKMLAEV